VIHYTKVLNGLAAYIHRELAAQFTGSLKGWAIEAVGGILAARAGQMMEGLMANPILKAMQIVDGEMVDEDLLISQLLAAAQASNATVNIPVLGPVTFTKGDVEALHRYIIGG
jgi:hypothetical protein